MILEDFKFISQQFYDYTHIPLLIFQKETLYYPHIEMSLETRSLLLDLIPLLNLPFKKEIKHPIVSDGVYMLAQFDIIIDSEVKRLLIGPTKIFGKSSSSVEKSVLSYINKELSSETEESFIKHVRFIQTILKLPKITNKIVYLNSIDNVQTYKEHYLSVLDERRVENYTRDSYQMELRILYYIKAQRIDKIKWIIKSLEREGNVKLSISKMQSINYKFVSLVAIMTRTAILDGIPVETAFSLSDSLINELDNMTTTRQVMDHILYASEHFMLLYKNKNTQNVSEDILRIYNYIDTHLYEKILLEDISSNVNLSKTYLSTKFKKETGQGISDYILEKRIDEAKEMLLFTQYTYQEITDRLNFSTQSYFIKCFKQKTQQTPQQFRNANWEYNIWD